MGWTDSRSAAAGTGAARHAVAHSDDAKAKPDERTGLRTRARWVAPVAIATLVVLVAGGAAGVVALKHGGTVESSGVKASPTPTQSPTPTTLPLSQTVPNGKWNVVTTTLRSKNPQQPVGFKQDAIWTFTSQCATTQCSGSVVSSGGARYAMTWDGSTLVLQIAPQKQPCTDDVTGEPVGGTYRNTSTPMQMRPDDASSPRMFAGKRVSTGTYTGAASNCPKTVEITVKSVATR